MSIRYANVINHLPETKMRLYPTKVINIIGGPGCDKSLFSAAIVLYLSLHGKTVETIPDFAKSLVWQQNFEVLKNQYLIAQRQFEMVFQISRSFRGSQFLAGITEKDTKPGFAVRAVPPIFVKFGLIHGRGAAEYRLFWG